jgi:hypothetical protein
MGSLEDGPANQSLIWGQFEGKHGVLCCVRYSTPWRSPAMTHSKADPSFAACCYFVVARTGKDRHG